MISRQLCPRNRENDHSAIFLCFAVNYTIGAFILQISQNMASFRFGSDRENRQRVPDTPAGISDSSGMMTAEHFPEDPGTMPADEQPQQINYIKKAHCRISLLNGSTGEIHGNA